MLLFSESEEKQIAECKKGCSAYELKIGVVSILFIGYLGNGRVKQDVIIRSEWNG